MRSVTAVSLGIILVTVRGTVLLIITTSYCLTMMDAVHSRGVGAFLHHQILLTFRVGDGVEASVG